MEDFTGAPQCPAETTELRDRVGAFVRDRVVPREPLLDAGGPEAAAALHGLREAATAEGLWALPLPAELGGQGLPLGSYAHVAEAEGASDHGPAALGSAPLLDALMLWRHGSPGVRDRYAERLVAGEIRACYAMTEPETPGTDPFLTATRAVPEEDGSWRVNGRKWFTSGAADADLVTVLARTDGEPPDREELSLLLVPTSSPGFRVVRELPVFGAGGQWEIALDEVMVDGDHVIGERGKALAVAGERLQLGRTLRCLRWLGQARRAFDLMRERAVNRTRSRGPLGDLQLVQQHVFESLLALRTTRPLVYEAVARLDAGADAHVEVGLAKVAAARTLQQVADAAIQVHGAAGLGPDTALPALFRTGRAARLLDGPDELHITSVARRVLRTT
ncbi:MULTISPECIES: acyl-CoA dehydrogenase family protein [unclassified Streptomyces]|uniref:acyl-CoA dehydrogenase family protein n=1 Tax=unclassified Streptomyces TaxID=2593676 RepID=UPI0005A81CB2|nr:MULTISPECIES: acyl-CoA dehydrogenase family protein [unclassified Streptomyces]ODA72884.1 (R)-benzylsuccinyl-CoA dehydrogenase [Streptomyces sp. AVP053U2]